MDRIDALAGFPKDRLRVLTGNTLAAELDGDLQKLVAEAAAELRIPIALVSLVLERTQFFRAQVGLPADLAETRATDRDASFCQFVVRDGAPFEVNDATRDPRVPQVDSALLALADLSPLARAVGRLSTAVAADYPALASLSKSVAALDDLRDILEEISGSNERLRKTVLALEHLLGASQGSTALAEALHQATRLAHHHTKLVGGVIWQHVPATLTVGVARSVAIATVATALAMLSQAQGALRSESGIHGAVRVEGRAATLELRVPSLEPIAAARHAADLDALVGLPDLVAISTRGAALCLSFPLVAA